MDTTPPGHWVLASHVLGRPVAVGEAPTPHVCGWTGTGQMTGRAVRLGWRDCVACAERAGHDPPEIPSPPSPIRH